MRKLDKKLMETALQSLLLPGEGYFGAVYAGFGRGSVLSTSALDNRYGFLAVTNQNRLLIAQYNILTMPLFQGALPLQALESLKVSKTILNMYSVKMQFRAQGETCKLACKISPNVYGMGLKEQQQNAEQLLKVLQKWNHAGLDSA
ncbi:MAG: hypothetical protein ACI4TG_03805 [Ruminococcus sp.]